MLHRCDSDWEYIKFFPKYYKKNEVIDTSPSQLIFLCNSSGSRPRLSTKNLSYTELSHTYVSLPQRLSTRTIAILIQRKFQNLCQRRCMLYRINQSYETSPVTSYMCYIINPEEQKQKQEEINESAGSSLCRRLNSMFKYNHLYTQYINSYFFVYSDNHRCNVCKNENV